MRRTPLSRSLFLLLTLAAATSCDDTPKPSSSAPTATAAPTSAPPPAPPEPKKSGMPELLVDEEGPYLGGTRIKLSDPTGPEKLGTVTKTLPINGQAVTLQVDKKALVSAVAAVVAALGEAGAPQISIKTEGRHDLPATITVTPESRTTAPPGCALVAMVMKDLSTAVWPARGGMAKKQRKGLAGPDLTRTGDQLEKDIGACDATTAMFSGEDAVGWESTFNLAGTVLQADKKKKLSTLVLLRDEPVAGRPVNFGKH